MLTGIPMIIIYIYITNVDCIPMTIIFIANVDCIPMTIIYIYIWCGFKSRRGKNKNLTALKSNSNTVWFNFQTYIIFSINLVSL